MRKRKVVELVELVYAPAESTGDWLERFGLRLTEGMGSAVLPFGYVFEKRKQGPPHFHEAFLRGNPDGLRWFRETHADLDEVMIESFFPTGTASSLFSERYQAGLEKGSTISSMDIERLMSDAGGDDSWAMYSVDASGHGVLCGSIVRGMGLHRRDREQHRRLAIHLAAGLRLRQAVADEARLDRAQAVLDPDGRVAHAQDDAVAGREALALAVARVERARSARRESTDEALDLWKALVEGRWSVVDHVDSDGRRFYLAISNPPLAVIDRALTRLEARVAAAAVAGESNKVIGYALGLSESSAAALLASAMRKLGVGSRVDLIRLGVAVGAKELSDHLEAGAEASAQPGESLP